MPKILHHGSSKGEFEPKYLGTDYFIFIHKPCNERAKVTHVLLDDHMRIIFNIECVKCGKRDALKTHPFVMVSKRPKMTEKLRKEIFILSSKYRKCCRTNFWDVLQGCTHVENAQNT